MLRTPIMTPSPHSAEGITAGKPEGFNSFLMGEPRALSRSRRPASSVPTRQAGPEHSLKSQSREGERLHELTF